MDLTDPELGFDGNGICDYCYEYDVKETLRKQELLELPWIIDEIKQQTGTYNCLLGLSGGVDSSLCLHYLVEQGLRPLTFSLDNGWNTKEAEENVLRLVEGLKVPFFRYRIDVDKFKELQTAFLQSMTPNVEIPTDHVLMAATYEVARKYNIKWIISGGNLATEGVMPKAWGYNARDLKFIRSIYRKFTRKNLSGIPQLGLIGYLVNRFIKGRKILNLLDYYQYNRQSAIELLTTKYGYQDYGEKHYESKFTQWFQAFYLPVYFGFDKRRAHYSSLIHSGQMTRDEALRLLAEPLVCAPIIQLEGRFKRMSHRDYPNHEWLWNLLSHVYGRLKWLRY